MNIAKNFIHAAFLFLTLTCLSIHLRAQSSGSDDKSGKVAALRALVDSQAYVFIAQSATPLSGRVRPLTYDYSLTVSRTAIICYLPYYGQSYTAPTDPTDDGLEFTSKKFNYRSTVRKKGGWEVTIKPKDQGDIQQMYFVITEDGYASLQVTSLNRQMISFTGYITAPQPKKSE
jgi:hypothetical protein